MEHSDLQRYVVGVLERLNVPYFITGSTATIFFGEPRFTNDLDVVVDLKPDHIAPFLTAFSSGDFYVSADAMRAAIGASGQFNIIHPTSGLKVDVMLLKGAAIDRSRMLRRVRVHLPRTMRRGSRPPKTSFSRRWISTKTVSQKSICETSLA